MAVLSELIARIVTALLTFWSGERERAAGDDAQRRAGAAESAIDTLEVVNDAADARAGLAAPALDPDDL